MFAIIRLLLVTKDIISIIICIITLSPLSIIPYIKPLISSIQSLIVILSFTHWLH